MRTTPTAGVPARPAPTGYGAADLERVVSEPSRAGRPEFERDRARIVHSAALRRLAAKTQVVGPASSDFVRNRLTHTLEVAQVGRDLAHSVGCDPDVVETACLAHDLGHPPFGHNGERALDEVSQGIGGFEGNAQTLRLLTRLEPRTFDDAGRPVGLNLTRACLDASTKYPWPLAEAVPPRGRHADGLPRSVRKFGVYDDDLPAFEWLRRDAPEHQLCVEAQVMDFADDVAYSVHDVEDGVVAGRIDLVALRDPALRDAVHKTTCGWYAASMSRQAFEEAYDRLSGLDVWPATTYDGTRRHLAGLKQLTSRLIGRFCTGLRDALEPSAGPVTRFAAPLPRPRSTGDEIAVLKGVVAHLVMKSDDRVHALRAQRELLQELVAGLVERPDVLTPVFRGDFAAAPDHVARRRVVIDQVASLTDRSAVLLHERVAR